MENQWNPVDPMEKLLNIITTYNQLFELYEGDDSKASTNSVQVLNMVEKEFKFVLNVLLNSKDIKSREKVPHYFESPSCHRCIDLTPVLFEAIDGVHRGIVRAGKQILQNGNKSIGGVVTRQQAEAASMKYQYNLVYSLFRLVNQVSSPLCLNTSASGVAFPHIFIDLEQKVGRYSLGALGSAVSLGLYRLYEPLVILGADTSDAVMAAVRNGDDLSLSMLLHLAYSNAQSHKDPSGRVKMLTPSDIINTLSVARALKFTHISERLEGVLYPDVSKNKRDNNQPFFNDFLPVKELESVVSRIVPLHENRAYRQ